MGLALYDAVQLAKKNQADHAALSQKHGQLQEGCAVESKAQGRERQMCQEDTLTPFVDTFKRVRNADLRELDSFDELPTGALPNAEVRKVRVNAASALGALAGGAASGAALGAATFAAVGALATASTGAAIAGLSGAAATSATLAWLGGGSIAAGGGGVAAGTTVLTGLVTAPVVLALAGFVEYKGRQQRREQQEAALQLRKAEAEFKVKQARAEAVLTRSKQIRAVLGDLRKEMSARRPGFDALVERNDDYSTYSDPERRYVGEVVNLALTVTTTVLGAAFVDEKGFVTDLSLNVVQDARQRLSVLAHA